MDTRATSIEGTIFPKRFFSNPKISLLILDELKKTYLLGEPGEIHQILGARAMDSLQRWM
jgi:hypothetical protein